MKVFINLIIVLLLVSCTTSADKEIPKSIVKTVVKHKQITKDEGKLYYQIGDLSKLQGGGFVHLVGMPGLRQDFKNYSDQAWVDFASLSNDRPMLSVEGFGGGKRQGSMYKLSEKNQLEIRSNENISNWTLQMLDLGFDSYIVCDVRDKSKEIFDLEVVVASMVDSLIVEFSYYDFNGLPMYSVVRGIILSQEQKTIIYEWYQKRVVQDLQYEDCLSYSVTKGRIPFCGIAHIIRLYRMNRLRNFFLACDQEDLHEVSRSIAINDWLCNQIGKSYWLN